MPLKTNNNLSKNPAPNTVGTLLNYKNSAGPWGLEAFYEGYRLVFSADLMTAGTLQKIARLFKTKPNNKNPGSIINNVDLYNMFSKNAKHAWYNACGLAQKRKDLLTVEDIFLTLLKEPSVINLLSRIKVSGPQAKTFINNYLKLTTPLDSAAVNPVREPITIFNSHDFQNDFFLPTASSTTFSNGVKKIPFEAFALAAKLHNHKIGSLMLLGGLLKATPNDNILQAIFSNIGLTAAKLELFAVWLLDLDYEFPPDSVNGKLLFCLRQAAGLEQHFGYFFELPAIEAAVNLSQRQTLKDLQHLKSLQLLVKAGLLAQTKKTKIISESLVRQAAT